MNRMKVCVASAKGGVGKTTSSVYFASILAHRFGGAILVDADPQASAAEWLEVSPIEGVEVREAPSERLVARAGERAGWRPVVVDTPPGHERLIRAAMTGVDRVVIAARAGGVEISRVQVTWSMVPQGVTTGLVLCAAEQRTVDFRSQADAWVQAGLPVWGAVPKRVAIARGPDGPLVAEGLKAYSRVLDATGVLKVVA